MTTENRRDLKLARVGEVGTESNGLGSGLDLERLLLGKTNLLSDLVRKFLVDGGEARQNTLLDLLRLASSEVTRNVSNKVLLLLIGEDSLVKVSRLLKVKFGNLGKILNGSSKELLVLGDVVRVLQMSLRVTLLSVNEVRELHGVSKEEDGSVVVNVIPISLLRSQLDRETSRVTSSVGRSTLSSDSRETSSSANLGSDLREELCASQVGNVVGDLKSTVSSCSLGMNDTFGDALSVEVSEGINQVEVLEEERSLSSSSLSGVGS